MRAKNPFAYFQENERSWQMINLLLFFAVCALLAYLLDFSLGRILAILGSFSFPAAVIYYIGKPALDSMANDYFINLPTKDLRMIAGVQIVVIAIIATVFLAKRFWSEIQAYTPQWIKNYW